MTCLKNEFEGADLGDKCLNKNLVCLAQMLSSKHGGVVSVSCGD